MSTKNAAAAKERRGAIQVSVHDSSSGVPLANAAFRLYLGRDAHGAALAGCSDQVMQNWDPASHTFLAEGFSGAEGQLTFTDLDSGVYFVAFDNVTPFVSNEPVLFHCATVRAGCTEMACFELDIRPVVDIEWESDGQPVNTRGGFVGNKALAIVSFNGVDRVLDSRVQVIPKLPWVARTGERFTFISTIRRAGPQKFEGLLQLARRGDNDPTHRVAGGSAAHTVGGGAAVIGLAAPAAPASLALLREFDAEERPPSPISGTVGVSLTRTETEPTEDLPLWTLIRNSTEALSFNNYLQFIDQLFCGGGGDLTEFERARFPNKNKAFQSLKLRRALPFNDAESYRVLKAATEAFVMVNCGVLNTPLAFDPTEDAAYLDRRDIPNTGNLSEVLANDYLESVDGVPTLPYLAVIRRKLPDIPITMSSGMEHEADLCFGIIQERLANPCLLELIWSYWHEEGMLVQSMNAITQRFQNLRAPGIGPDPLANTEIDMLRPLNNLLWGYTQDEQHRLTVVRRNYEYDHHYGIRLDGKAVRHFRPADSRSQFLEAFHHLLRLLTSFYKQDDDTTVKADAFPVLNALKEVHLILSQGAHNQYGDLPSTARIEMLMQQWLLARPEFREFLPTRVMVAYPEPWMDRVDAMKKLQGWTDTSVMHFRSLAMFGEQLFLSIRYGNWSDIYESTQAFNWARFWRPQAQGYIHAYRAATGVDLSVDGSDAAADSTLPSVLLRQRLSQQQRNA
ncbi:hypothetical protein [Massilia sp. YIM B04103]|uniref:hypothetical protein n=1 Tax=Massilia sp. YIM B04103 TaxID=2963106 RepID=UPI00210C9E5C|nr:hypothetical protein [Massilia sp. YIM B04103]